MSRYGTGASRGEIQYSWRHSAAGSPGDLHWLPTDPIQEYWEEKTGDTVTIDQSHAGSSKQAQAIIQGLKADVATFNQVTDINILHERGRLIPEDWADRLPNNSSPYYSTMAFLVRKGNPKNIENWDDLVNENVDLVMPNPKTSGNARYTYLAALGYAQETFGDDQEKIDQFLSDLLGRVMLFISLVLLLPLTGLVMTTAEMSWDPYWFVITDPRVVESYKVTLWTAFGASVFNGLFGLLLAWVLVRYQFPGRRIIDAMVDLPFALPTAVAGITLATLYSESGCTGSKP